MEDTSEIITRELIAKAYALLLSRAREGRSIYYTDFGDEIGIPIKGNEEERRKASILVGNVCAIISKAEVAEGRPMLSAIVISKKDELQLPTLGFYKLAKNELGKYHGPLAKRDYIPPEAEAFANAEIEAVFETWKTRNIKI